MGCEWDVNGTVNCRSLQQAGLSTCVDSQLAFAQSCVTTARSASIMWRVWGHGHVSDCMLVPDLAELAEKSSVGRNK